jgi:hypothetical protein
MPYVVPERQPRPLPRRRAANIDLLPATQRERRIADLVSETLELLQVERLATIRQRNPDDDDEAPTRRLGAAKKRR